MSVPLLRALLLIGVALLSVSQAGSARALLVFVPAAMVTTFAVFSERSGEGRVPAVAWTSAFGFASLGVFLVGIHGNARLEWMAFLLLGTLVGTARNLFAGLLAGCMASLGFLYVGLKLDLAAIGEPVLLGPAFVLLSAGALMGVAQEQSDQSWALREELATLGESLRNVLSCVGSGVLVVEGDQREVTTINPAATRILGLAEHKAIGRPLAAGPLQALAELLSGTPDSAGRSDVAFLREDGSQVQIGYDVSPLVDRAGRRLGTILVFQDVTLIRDYEERMLRQEKLAALGRLVSGIAHEFGNQLGGARGLLDLALLEDDPREAISSLEPVRETLTRSLTTVENLLRFARGTPLQLQPGVDLALVLQRALDLLRAQIEASGLLVEVQLQPVPLLVLDPIQLEQVVLNLVINAIHATESCDPPRLTITLALDGAEVLLSLDDNGPGVPEPVRAKIFEPFFTTKGALGGSSTPGTGLGLSMVLGVVEAHSGRLSVDTSPLLAGARFRIWVPSTKGEA